MTNNALEMFKEVFDREEKLKQEWEVFPKLDSVTSLNDLGVIYQTGAQYLTALSDCMEKEKELLKPENLQILEKRYALITHQKRDKTIESGLNRMLKDKERLYATANTIIKTVIDMKNACEPALV
jgi:hypothetical protein